MREMMHSVGSSTTRRASAVPEPSGVVGPFRVVVVSVVVALRNQVDFVGFALESLLAQSFVDWEAIVVDDASTDGSADVVERFCGDPRVRLVRLSENVGAGAARNVAIGLARGRYFAVLDADDVCLPGRLELQVAAFEADPELVVVGGQVAEFGRWGGPRVACWPVSSEVIAERLARMRMPVAHCAAMFRVDAVREVGGYDEDALRAEDFALMLRLRGRKMRGLDELVVLYRRERPSRFAYVVASGRYGRLVRYRARKRDWTRRPRSFGLPGSTWVDLRSTAQWAAERLGEDFPRVRLGPHSGGRR